MSLFENFPFTNLHQLNLNWLIEEVKKCYSPDNPPEAMVISVNGESGVVTLYRDAHVNLPDITEEQWNIYRGSANKITGIEFNKDNPATRINGNQRFVIYDAGNPPPYPVIAVNGETGNVILYEEPYVVFPDVEGNNWGLERKLNTDTADETRVGIMFDDTGKAYITHDEEASQILTLEDIPSSSGVVSFNGQTGVVVVKGSDLIISTSDTRTISQGFSDMETNDNNIKGSLAYVENTNTATRNIPSGAYVIWQNNDYISTQAIAIGDTLSGTNLTPLNEGGITNNLKNTLNTNKANASNYPNTNKILASATDDTTVGFKIEYPSTGTFSILYTDVFGRFAHIYRSSGNANLYMINGTFNATVLRETETYLNVGNWVRAQMIITGSDIALDNIRVTTYST